MNEDLEVLCARTEALHVHGYREMAGKLAVKLAENILNNGNNLVPFSHSGGTRNKRRGPGKGSFARSIFVKAAFLCSVLEDDLHLHHLAFRVGMMGLEMPRQPARSKALEVRNENTFPIFLKDFILSHPEPSSFDNPSVSVKNVLSIQMLSLFCGEGRNGTLINYILTEISTR